MLSKKNLFPGNCAPLLSLLLLSILFAFHSRGQMRQVYVDTDQNNEIEKIDFYSPSEGYVAFTKWIGFTADTGRTFTKKYITNFNVDFGIYSVNLTFGFGIKGVKAFNRDTLIVYGDYGFVPAILYSTNQGNSFKLVYHSQYDGQGLNKGITDMTFISESNIGYAVEADRIIKTTNKGVSWSVVRFDTNRFFDFVQAVNNNTVFALSRYHSAQMLMISRLGGSGWQAINLPEQERVRSVFFLTDKKGWLNIDGEDGTLSYIYYTSNSGQTWIKKNDAVAVTMEKMLFLNDSVGYGISHQNQIYKTTDSGKVWEPFPRDNNYSYLNYSHNDLFKWNSSQLWAGGGHGFLELTTNGGDKPLPKAYFKIDVSGAFSDGKVNLINHSKVGYQYKWFNGDVLIGTSYHASYTHSISKAWDTLKLVVTDGLLSDTSVRYQYFEVPPLPQIISFSPLVASEGSLVTITGTNFSQVSKVSFGGVAASSFTIVSPTNIIAVVGKGASGNVTVTTNYYTYTHTIPGFVYSPPSQAPAPLIISLSPSYGPIGTTVTISGNNFAPSVSGNIVYFGTVKAVVTQATATEITCNVPGGAGYRPVSVLNKTSSLTGTSQQQFTVTFSDNLNFAAKSFVKKFTLTSHELYSPYHSESGDIDGDGKLDLLYSFFGYQDSLVVRRNITKGEKFEFEAPLGFEARAAGFLALRDLDGDGKLDIAAATNQKYITVLRNKSMVGSIAFDAHMQLPTTARPQMLAIDDLDNDGRPDIAIGGYRNTEKISVLRNTSVPGAISFAQDIIESVVGLSNGIAIGDLNNDSKKDIVEVNLLTNGQPVFITYKNISTVGKISFASKTNYPIPTANFTPSNPVLADFDSDGKLDIIILSHGNFFVFKNISTVDDILFTEGATLVLPNIDGTITVDNLNGDRMPDVMGGTLTQTGVTAGIVPVFRNLSTSGIIKNDNPVNTALSHAYYIKSADFNNDGRPDIIGSFPSHDQLDIYQNMVGLPIKVPVCDRGDISFTADLEGQNYKWQRDTGNGFFDIVDDKIVKGSKTNTLKFVKVPLAWKGYNYRCLVDTLKSSIFQMDVLGGFPNPVVTISTPSVEICEKTSVTFTAEAINAGEDLNYLWLINNRFEAQFRGINQFTTNKLKNGDRVSVVIYAGGMCMSNLKDTSNVITVNVTGSQPAISLSGPQAATCKGSSITFTATVTNEGTDPIYEWMRNGVVITTTPGKTYTSTEFNHGDIVSVTLKSKTLCNASSSVASNQITVQRKEFLEATATISNVVTSICDGTPVTFTANFQPSAGTQSFQWQVNDVNVGTNSNTYTTSTLTNESGVRVIVITSPTDAVCLSANIDTSGTVTMTVNPKLSPSLVISGNSTVKPNQSTTLNAFATNGGSDPRYQWQDSTVIHGWQDILGANVPALPYKPAKTGDKIRCILTSNYTCSTSPIASSNTLSFKIEEDSVIIPPDPGPIPNPNPPSTNNNGIFYYPNPVTDQLTIDSLKLVDQWEVLEITTLSGSQILITENITNKTKVTISVGRLPNGIYVAILKRSIGAPAAFKFVKM